MQEADSKKLPEYAALIIIAFSLLTCLFLNLYADDEDNNSWPQQPTQTYQELCFGNSETEIASLLSIRDTIAINYLPEDIQVQPDLYVKPITEESGGNGRCILEIQYSLNGKNPKWYLEISVFPPENLTAEPSISGERWDCGHSSISDWQTYCVGKLRVSDFQAKVVLYTAYSIRETMRIGNSIYLLENG